MDFHWTEKAKLWSFFRNVARIAFKDLLLPRSECFLRGLVRVVDPIVNQKPMLDRTIQPLRLRERPDQTTGLTWVLDP